MSHATDDLIFRWDSEVPLVVDDRIELPQLDLEKNVTGDCTQSYMTGHFLCSVPLRHQQTFFFPIFLLLFRFFFNRSTIQYYIEINCILKEIKSVITRATFFNIQTEQFWPLKLEKFDNFFFPKLENFDLKHQKVNILTNLYLQNQKFPRNGPYNNKFWHYN